MAARATGGNGTDATARASAATALATASASTQPLSSGHVMHPDAQLIVSFLHNEDPTNAIKAGLRRGFTFITTSELADGLMGRRVLPHKCCLLTYDDGHKLQYDTIHPIIQSFGIKATLGITSGFLDGESLSPSWANFLGSIPMSWDNARAMYASGNWDIQNHTRLHYPLSGRTQAERAADITYCGDRIQAEIGFRPKTLAFPHGDFPHALRDELPGLGIELGFSTNVVLGFNEPSWASETRYTVNRLNSAAATWLDSYYDGLIYTYERDRDASFNYLDNDLGYWSAIPTGGSWLASTTGYDLILDSTSNGSAASWISADYFRVHGAARIAYRFWAQMTSQNAGNGGIRLVQYDASKVALGSPNATIKNWTTADAGVFYTDEITLDPAARYVRLEVYADASCNGKIDIGRLRVTVA